MSDPVQLDASQRKIKSTLDALLSALDQKPQGLFAKIFAKKAQAARGIYIWGSVGRGKTMLMDQFFEAAPNLPKRRVHFHAFMQEVHQARAAHKSDDVIAEIAQGIASQTKLLCLDEMQISDIADATILGRLFDALWARGVTIVTTSNQPPEGLYKDGLNRHLFLPFVSKLNATLDVVHLQDGKDYRLGRIVNHQLYVTPLGAKAGEAIEQIWHVLADGEIGKVQDIVVLGRKLRVPKAAHSCARFSFSELCEQPLGAPDYLALAQNFRTVMIEQVPVLKASDRNQTKRFILLIDTLYDAGTRVVISAAALPEKLCTKGQHAAEFLRTVSRLNEMQSASWWEK